MKIIQSQKINTRGNSIVEKFDLASSERYTLIPSDNMERKLVCAWRAWRDQHVI